MAKKRTANGTLDAEKRTPKRARTIDASTGAVLPPVARTPLKTIEQLSRELARVYRSVKAGDLPSEEGSRRAYIINTLGKLLESADLERRLDQLERARLPGAPPLLEDKP